MLSDYFQKTERLQQFRRQIERVARRRGLTDPNDHDDVVQEILLAFLQRNPQTDDPERFEKWCNAVAANKCVDMIRKKDRQRRRLEELSRHEQAIRDNPDPLPPTAESLPCPEVVLIRRGKRGLAVLWKMWYSERLSQADIARHMKLSEATISRKLGEAKVILRTAFRDYREE